MARLKIPLRLPFEQMVWEARRWCRAVVRQVGWPILVIVGSGLVAVPAALQTMRLSDELTKVSRVEATPTAPAQSSANDSRSRLREFELFLLPHEDIPAVIEDVIRLAEKERLVFKRGQYKPEVDSRGEFLRYRMILPVKGEAQAIYGFMNAALLAHKNLALESVQFRREGIEARDVEARLNWVLLTHLPATTPVSPDAKSQKGGVR